MRRRAQENLCSVSPRGASPCEGQKPRFGEVMPQANLRPFSGKARPFPVRAPGLRARKEKRGRLWERLSSRHPAGEPKGSCHRLGCQPQTQPMASRRPVSAIPAANVPHCPLLRSSEASCSGALPQRIHRSRPAAAGSRRSARTHRHREPTRHLRFARQNHSSACKSQAARGEPSVRPGRHGRGNPSSTDALFIRRFSIPAVGGRLARPPPPRPRAGETPELFLSPPLILTLRFCVGILPGERPHASSEQKPRELYSDTRELLAREEAHAGRLVTKRLRVGASGTEKGGCGAHFLGERGIGASDPDDLQQSQSEANPKKRAHVHPRTGTTHKDVSLLPLHSAFSPLPLYPRYLSRN